MIHLLIVDDEPSVLSALRRALRQHFAQTLEIQTCTDPAHALALVRAKKFDIVLSDLRMPDLDGLGFLSLVSALSPASVRMVLTGSADFETAQRAINEAGVFRFLTKPWTDAELRGHMAAAVALCKQVASATPSAPPSAEAVERCRLEALEPGITAVEWGPGGEVLMSPLEP